VCAIFSVKVKKVYQNKLEMGHQEPP